MKMEMKRSRWRDGDEEMDMDMEMKRSRWRDGDEIEMERWRC